MAQMQSMIETCLALGDDTDGVMVLVLQCVEGNHGGLPQEGDSRFPWRWTGVCPVRKGELLVGNKL